MKIAEMIARLQYLREQHGDVEIMIADGDSPADWPVTEVRFDADAEAVRIA